jgi:hypothetical protein
MDKEFTVKCIDEPVIPIELRNHLPDSVLCLYPFVISTTEL